MSDEAVGASPGLPFVDAHEVVLPVGRGATWAALEGQVARDLTSNRWPKAGLGFLLGTRPAAGFEVAERDAPARLVLAGRHRFSRYRLTFQLEDAPDEGETTMWAVTHAKFPGVHGALYRTLVIRTGLHVLATRRILVAVRRRAEAGA